MAAAAPYASPARARLLGVRAKPSPKIIETFLILEFACQVALLFPVITHFRIILRTLAFGTSLLLLLVLSPRRPIHPAIKPALWALAAVGLSIFYPTTNSLLSGLAQFAMYVAILAPLLWVSRLRLNKAGVRRVLLVIFVFQTISSLIGVLQVEFPGRLRGNISSVVTGQGSSYVKQLYYRNAWGQMVMRPSGLTDVPGGVCTAGVYAAVLGFYFFVSDRSGSGRIAAATGALVGGVAVYLSGVKASMIELLICSLVFIALTAWRNRGIGAVVNLRRRQVGMRTASVLMAAVLLGGISYFLAARIGGQGGLRSLSALTSNDPRALFYHERGRFLDYTVNVLLPKYPFGAGLGRWGMMSYYFGDPNNPNSSPIWVEIQWTGWLLDGGIPLIVAYALALFTAFRFALKCVRARLSSELTALGALVGAYDAATLAGTLDFVPFIGQIGMDFWLLNAMLFGAVTHARQVRLGRLSR